MIYGKQHNIWCRYYKNMIGLNVYSIYHTKKFITWINFQDLVFRQLGFSDFDQCILL